MAWGFSGRDWTDARPLLDLLATPATGPSLPGSGIGSASITLVNFLQEFRQILQPAFILARYLFLLAPGFIQHSSENRILYAPPATVFTFSGLETFLMANPWKDTV